MIKKLIKLSNHLDEKGLHKEADYLDSIIKSADPRRNEDLDAPVTKYSPTFNLSATLHSNDDLRKIPLDELKSMILEFVSTHPVSGRKIKVELSKISLDMNK